MMRVLAVLGLLVSSSVFAQPCGHLSQLAHARACLKGFAEALIREGSNGEHLVYVTGSEKGMKAIAELVNDYRGGDLTDVQKLRILEQATRSEWAGLVIQIDDEPLFHYFLLESGEEPMRVLDFSPLSNLDLFPTLYRNKNPGPFTLYLKGLEKWIYELFEYFE